MPPRDETIRRAIEFFNDSRYPTGLTPATAWLGFYQTLLWYEQVNHLGYTTLPHIIDANNLRPASPTQAEKWRTKRAWQKRAEALNAYIASHLGCDELEVQDHMDRMMRNIGEMQRQNSLGIAFAGLMKYFLERFGATGITYETEVPAKDIFPGIVLPGRSDKPCIDVFVRREGTPMAIVSTKWSLRHDRLNDLTNECPIYKAAYSQVFRQTRQAHLRYYVATNEFEVSRLTKLLDDTCIDGVVHVHKQAVQTVAGLNGELDRFIDLSEFHRIIEG